MVRCRWPRKDGSFGVEVAEAIALEGVVFFFSQSLFALHKTLYNNLFFIRLMTNE